MVAAIVARGSSDEYGILEHDLHVAPGAAQLRWGELREILPFELAPTRPSARSAAARGAPRSTCLIRSRRRARASRPRRGRSRRRRPRAPGRRLGAGTSCGPGNDFPSSETASSVSSSAAAARRTGIDRQASRSSRTAMSHRVPVNASASLRTQRASPPCCVLGRSSMSPTRHASSTYEHRVANRQPVGTSPGLGTSPGNDGQAVARAARPAASNRADLRRTGARDARKDPSTVASLDDLTGVHHHDALGDVGDDTEVVGHEDHGHAELALQRFAAARGSAPGS